jgi:hypothetical protein
MGRSRRTARPWKVGGGGDGDDDDDDDDDDNDDSDADADDNSTIPSLPPPLRARHLQWRDAKRELCLYHDEDRMMMLMTTVLKLMMVTMMMLLLLLLMMLMTTVLKLMMVTMMMLMMMLTAPLTLFTSGLDICNGKMRNGSYSYFLSPTFPYVVGCFGPGADSAPDERYCRQ